MRTRSASMAFACALAPVLLGCSKSFSFHYAEVTAGHPRWNEIVRENLGCDPCSSYREEEPGFTFLYDPDERVTLGPREILGLFITEAPPDHDWRFLVVAKLSPEAKMEFDEFGSSWRYKTLVVTSSGRPIGTSPSHAYANLVHLAQFHSRQRAEQFARSARYESSFVPFDPQAYEELRERLRSGAK